MELEEQVVSLELAKKLKELGVKQESVFAWFNGKVVAADYEHSVREYGGASFSAFTVAELGEMLPWDIVIARNIGRQWHITFQANGMIEKEIHVVASQDNEADARAKMLIYLIENKFISITN